MTPPDPKDVETAGDGLVPGISVVRLVWAVVVALSTIYGAETRLEILGV